MPEERDAGKGLGSRQKPSGAKGIGERIGRSVSSAASSAAASSSSSPTASAGAEQERESLESRASALASKLSDLRSEASMAQLRDRVEDLSGQLAGFPAVIEKLRREGYVYKSYLENKVQVLQEQWEGLGQRIDREAAQQGRVLTREVDKLQRQLSAMGANLRENALSALERDITTLEGKIDDAFSGFRGLFDTVESNAYQTERQLKSIQWTLEQVSEASFRLRTDENVIEAVEATYLTDGDEGPEGILYLTDQRILFEQKEDVATKKFLFITTEKERIQELKLEAPIGAVEEAKPSERRKMLRKKELLELTFGPQAPVTLALFQLKADSEPWQGYIGRVISGDIDRERVGAAAPAGEETPSEPAPAPSEPSVAVPTACPTCGAAITTEIVRGMKSISCEYCGTVMRI
jgi:predicted  nucleic acid-binding Zn-ribbon protein